MNDPTIETLVERIDLLAYHIGALEAENTAIRRAMSSLFAERNAAIDRELRAKHPTPTPAPVRRIDWAQLGPVTRRRIA